MATAVRSHAKINLGLGIGAPRADGFHGLVTVYQTLEMHDVVTVSARRAAATALGVSSNDGRVPVDERNTAWKIVSLVLDELGVQAEVSIHIEKRLPVQGGLGAGSANAVAALVGLEAELEIRDGLGAHRGLTGETSCGRPAVEWTAKRLEIAAKVGSDVPLFLIGGTVLGLDRGQEVYPLPEIEPVWCVVAAPEVGVSTPQAFRDWDALCMREGLTAEASRAKLSKLSCAYASAFAGFVSRAGRGARSSGVFPSGEDLAGPEKSALVRTGITSWMENDFERVVFAQHPSLGEIKRLLLGPAVAGRSSCVAASLSGSGSALYGLYLARADAEAAQARIGARFGAAEVKTTLTRTLPRKAYWEQMVQV